MPNDKKSIQELWKVLEDNYFNDPAFTLKMNEDQHSQFKAMEEKIQEFKKKHQTLFNKVDGIVKTEITKDELKEYSKDLKTLEQSLLTLSLPAELLIAVVALFSAIIGAALGGSMGALIGTAAPGAGTLIGGVTGLVGGATLFGSAAAIGTRNVLIDGWKKATLNFVEAVQNRAEALQKEQDANYITPPFRPGSPTR